MTVFVTGKEGFIARILIRRLLDSGFEVKGTSVDVSSGDLYMDLLNPEKFNYGLIKKGDIIVHLSAISSPDVCENNYEFAYNVNVKGTEYFLSKCLDSGAKVLFFSSDTVYGGNFEGVFDEKSEINPVGKYAEMKREIEKTFENNDNFKVLRLSYIFAKEDKYMKYLSSCIENGKEAEVYITFLRNVVYVGDLLDAVFAVIRNFDEFGWHVCNICGPELLSRLKLAELYKNIVNKNLKIKDFDPGEEFFKNRPRRICVKSLYLDRLLGRKPVGIEKAMQIEFNEQAK